jgi:hypothetical protein
MTYTKKFCNFIIYDDKIVLTYKIIITLCVCLCIGLVLNYFIPDTPFFIAQPNISLTKNCSSGDLTTDMNCLNEKLNGFYKYNLSQAGKLLTEKQMIEDGGVCSHYSEWYKINAQKMGYNAQTIVMKAADNMYHEIAIVSGNYSYCVMDQSVIGCIKLK